jgi:hypothetical protein
MILLIGEFVSFHLVGAHVCVALGGLLLIAVASVEIHTYKTLVRDQINAVTVCHRVNAFINKHYLLHGALTVVLLVSARQAWLAWRQLMPGRWIELLINLPLFAYRAYMYVR